ncbi:aldolase [Paenibacillus humicola]|uniref:aldolase n=1 Tax=Paenibacillus humicola TaxID=3110540 RepID=UPI00237B1DFB|nr:aldolase [Paenibacillus humicola]
MNDSNCRFTYKAFGLRVESEISLPELTEPDGFELPEPVHIHRCDLASEWQAQDKIGQYWAVAGMQVMFTVPEVGIFRIQDGSTIHVSPFADALEDRVRLYILGTCFGAVLLHRRILPLHGSAVAINGKAYAVVGHSGAGKSTLASTLVGLGYKLLSDDVIPVIVDDQTPVVIPAYPQQKLWQDSMNQLGLPESDYRPIFSRETKFAIPVRAHFHDQPLPLAGVFELMKTADTEVMEPIRGMERFHMLYRHTYRPFLVNDMGLREWHFGTLARIVNRFACYRLSRGTARFSAHELASRLLGETQKEESIHAPG